MIDLELLAPGLLLEGHLVAPEPVLVVVGKAGHHDGDGEGEDEHAGQGAEAAQQLPRERLGVPEGGSNSALC